MSGTRTAWFHCFAGIAGDMALGSLLDAGAGLPEVLDLLGRLPIGGWSLEAEPVLRAGISATRAVVSVGGDGVVRTLPDILAIIEKGNLPDRVARRSVATFTALAEVEARLHGRSVTEVHFHELGGHDTVIDVVGTIAALEVLGVDEVRASPVAMGTGVVKTAHGLLPNPPPAVLRLLAGAPLYGRDLPVELTTPTGAALLATLASGFGPIPPLVVESSGYGAGSRELEGMPNCTEVVIGTATTTAAASQPLVLLETNLDDVTGEQVADAVEALLSAGALDAWIAPVIMKKGRPGQVLSALCPPGAAGELRRVMLEATGTFGVRSSEVQRYAASRGFEEVSVGGQAVRVKVAGHRAKVEHDDALAAARASGRSVAEVADAALRSYRERHPEDTVEPGS